MKFTYRTTGQNRGGGGSQRKSPSTPDTHSQWSRKHQGCFTSLIPALLLCIDSTYSWTTLCNKIVLLRVVTNLQIQNPVRQPFLTAHQFLPSSFLFLSKQDSKIYHYIHTFVNTLKSLLSPLLFVVSSNQPWMNPTSCLLCILVCT